MTIVDIYTQMSYVNWYGTFTISYSKLCQSSVSDSSMSLLLLKRNLYLCITDRIDWCWRMFMNTNNNWGFMHVQNNDVVNKRYFIYEVFCKSISFLYYTVVNKLVKLHTNCVDMMNIINCPIMYMTHSQDPTLLTLRLKALSGWFKYSCLHFKILNVVVSGSSYHILT